MNCHCGKRKRIRTALKRTVILIFFLLITAFPAQTQENKNDKERKKSVRQLIKINRNRYQVKTSVYSNTKPWVLFVENKSISPRKEQEVVRRWKRELSRIKSFFLQLYGKHISRQTVNNLVLPVYLFTASSEENAAIRFNQKTGGMKNPGVLFAREGADDGWVLACYKSQVSQKILRDRRHELVHQFLWHLRKKNNPDRPIYFWIHEGLAQYFESIQKNKSTGNIVPGPLTASQKKRLRKIKNGNTEKIPTFANLFTLNRSVYREKILSLEYDSKICRTLTLSVLLYLHENAERKNAFSRYLSEYLRGNGGAKIQKKWLGTPAELNKGWKEYINQLLTKSRQK